MANARERRRERRKVERTLEDIFGELIETIETDMDLSAFNKELGNKIARAKALERNSNVNAAIALWLEISEMALKFSKSRNLNVSFKNMIINRTQGIFKHVKNLKASQHEEEHIFDDVQTQEETPLVEPPLEIVKPEKSGISEQNSPENNQRDSPVTDHNIVENSEFKNIPKGFKEIHISEEFKIITPHDENYVKKTLSQVEKRIDSIPKKKEIKDKKFQPTEERFEFEQPENGQILICFACGSENSIDIKICKSCGTKLS